MMAGSALLVDSEIRIVRTSYDPTKNGLTKTWCQWVMHASESSAEYGRAEI